MTKTAELSVFPHPKHGKKQLQDGKKTPRDAYTSISYTENAITGKVPAHGTNVPRQGKKVPTTGTNAKTIETNTKYILKIEKNIFHSKKPLPT